MNVDSPLSAWEQAGLEPWLDEIGQLWPEARQRLQDIAQPSHLARASYRDAVQQQYPKAVVRAAFLTGLGALEELPPLPA